MPEPLTGYEATSVADVEAFLDDNPAASSDEVYLGTVGHSERAIAAVAAKRAGGGGGGSTPATFNYYGSTTGAGPPDVVPSGQLTDLTWWPTPTDSYPGQGAQPFDLTDKTNPVVLADGVYTITCEMLVREAHAGKHLWGLLFLDRSGINDGPAASTDISEADAFGTLGAIVSVTSERFLSAGMVVHSYAAHTAGVDLDVYFWAQLSWVPA